MIKIGQILIMKDGRKLLVGNVNELLGVCDDCKEYVENIVETIDTDSPDYLPILFELIKYDVLKSLE